MANRRGLRFLAKVYQNLPPEIINRHQQVPVVSPQNGTRIPSATVPQPIHDRVGIEERLNRIERLLGQLLVQKRVKVVERDQDDLITRVVDMPLDQTEVTP